MEQPNMMLPNGMPPNMNTMQRPQPGNVQQQIHARIMSDLRNSMNQVGQGWQSTFDIRERASHIMQLVTHLRFMNQDIPKCLNIAQNFELKAIQQAPNKELYTQQMKQKLADITAKKREQIANQMPNGIMGPGFNPGLGANNMNMQNNPMAGMNMANVNMPMQNGKMNQGIPQQNNTSFPAHLQRPMQPSPIPPTQQPATMDPSALQAPQMMQQMSGTNQNNPQQTPNLNPGQGNQGMSNPPNPQEIMALARRMHASMPEEARQAVRSRYLASLTQEQRARETAGNSDPLLKVLFGKARENIMKQRGGQSNQNVQQNNGVQMGNIQGLMGGNMQQPAAAQTSNANIDFSSILSQQSNALKQQESGEQVVPASNNGFGLGNQINMPQGINPQMLANQANQQGNDQQQMNPQLQALLRDQQRQQQLQRQNVLAQQQAMAQRQQAGQLRGQPGGLNAPNALNGGPAGQVHSPAMSMLNRPMVPPGQATPGTPQQNRPQGAPQTPMNNPNQQLMQHHQQMLQNNQQMNQGGQGSTPQQRMQLMQQLQQLPQNLRDGLWEKLQTMPPAHASVLLARFQASKQGNQMNNQAGQGNIPPNLNMAGAQPGNQMFNGMPQNMGSAVPGFNSQPPPNSQMENLQMQQRMHIQNQRHHLRQQAMDMRTFPATVPKTLGMSLPQEANTWGALKRHVTQNQAVLPPQTMERLQMLQNQDFEQNPEALEQSMHALRQSMAGQQAQPQPSVSGAPSNMSVAGGQAPPAQMVPPAAPMQPSQGPGQNANQGQPRQPPNMPQISQQEIQLIRQKNPALASMSDDQIRLFVWQRRMQNVAARSGGMNPQMVAQQQALRAAQMRGAQAASGPQGGNMPNGNQQGPPRPPQQQQQQGPQPSNQQANGQAQSQKRPQVANDDVMEIPNPNAPQVSAPQAPPMQAAQPQQPSVRAFPFPSEKQLQSMTPQQRANFAAAREKQIESLRRAQQGLSNGSLSAPAQPTGQPPSTQNEPNGGAQASPAQLQAKAQTMYEEIAKANPKGPGVQIDDEGLNQAKAILKKMWSPALRMPTTWQVVFATPGYPEAKIRNAMKARVLVLQNAKDEQGNIKDYLSLNAARLREIQLAFSSYYSDMKQLAAAKAAAQAAQAQGQRTPSGMTKPPQPPQAAPMGQSTSQQAHGRKPSQSSKPPPAPIDNKSYDWGAPSPHGVPKYDTGRNELTPDKLRFPPQKKRRTGQPDSQGSTPVGQTTTPGPVVSASPNVQAAKMPSPEQARRTQQQVKQEWEAREAEQRKFKCQETFCDASIRGFETEEELKKHVDFVHQTPDDPLAFLLENAADALALDMQGQPKASEQSLNAEKVKAQPRATPVLMAKAQLKRDGVTPSVKQEVATPASASQGKTRPGPTSAPPEEAPAKEKTLREVMEEKMGFEPFPSTAPKDSSLPDAPATEVDESWQEVIRNSLSGVDSLDDWSLFDHPHIDIGLPPHPADTSSPSLTPSDGSTSQSSHESDISRTERMRINFEWDAFGNGDTMVPEHLRMMRTLELDEGAAGLTSNGGTDTAMADAAPQDPAKEKAPADPWDWSGDLTGWVYGDDAGLT